MLSTEPRSVLEGERVTFTCQATANPPVMGYKYVCVRSLQMSLHTLWKIVFDSKENVIILLTAIWKGGQWEKIGTIRKWPIRLFVSVGSFGEFYIDVFFFLPSCSMSWVPLRGSSQITVHCNGSRTRQSCKPAAWWFYFTIKSHFLLFLSFIYAHLLKSKVLIKAV